MARAKISVAKMTLAKTKAAEAHFPMLSAFHSIADQSLNVMASSLELGTISMRIRSAL
jgi:hypothetical protein